VPVDAFRHRAIWNDRMSRIEMHLEAVRDVAFEVEGERFAFGKARPSTPRTATNTAIATPACCSAPPAGRCARSGPTPTTGSRSSLQRLNRPGSHRELSAAA
jgi:hypothetical protein